MKLRNDDIFSRPMLRETYEDFNTLIKAVYKIETTKDNIVLHYDIHIDSPTYIQYINEGKISLYIHIYSQKIMYRNIFELNINAPNGELKLKRDEIFGKIEVSTILVAKSNFCFKAQEELVDDDDEYEVSRGMILGYSESFEIEVDFSKMNLSDLVSIRPTTAEERFNTIEVSNEVIYYMANDEYRAYENLYRSDNVFTKRLIKIVHNAIYTRLLYKIVELNTLSDEDPEFLDTRIYEYLTQMFELSFPEVDLTQIEVEDINNYAIKLSDISFVDIEYEGEGDE